MRYQKYESYEQLLKINFDKLFAYDFFSIADTACSKAFDMVEIS